MDRDERFNNIEQVISLAKEEVSSQEYLEKNDPTVYNSEERQAELDSVEDFMRLSPDIYEKLKEAMSHIEWLTEEYRKQSTKDLLSRIDDIIKEVEG